VSILVVQQSLFVNRRIVECSSKVLAPRIVRRYALSKGSAKGLQGVCNAYCNRSGGCFSSRGASSEGSNQARRRTRIKGSSKVLAPKGRRQAQLRGRGICGAQEGGGAQ
jgi:hypothetical protein